MGNMRIRGVQLRMRRQRWLDKLRVLRRALAKRSASPVRGIRLRHRLAQLMALLVEAWPVWVGVGMPLFGWYVVPHLIPGHKSIQYVGVALETMGVMLVAYELIEVREQLESPSVLTIARGWLARFRNVFRSGVEPAAAPHAAGTMGSADARAADRFAEAHPAFPDHFAVMMSVVEQMYRKLDALQRIRELESRLTSESRHASNQLAVLTSQLQKLSLGNLGREFVGVCLIVFGLIMANLPEEIHRMWQVLAAN